MKVVITKPEIVILASGVIGLFGDDSELMPLVFMAWLFVRVSGICGES